MRSLVEKYRLGMITDDHLVVESLNMVDPQNPGLALASLPEDILQRVLQFANQNLQGKLVSNYGTLPSEDQVLAAKNWVEQLLQQTANKAV